MGSSLWAQKGNIGNFLIISAQPPEDCCRVEGVAGLGLRRSGAYGLRLGVGAPLPCSISLYPAFSHTQTFWIAVPTWSAHEATIYAAHTIHGSHHEPSSKTDSPTAWTSMCPRRSLAQICNTIIMFESSEVVLSVDILVQRSRSYTRVALGSPRPCRGRRVG